MNTDEPKVGQLIQEEEYKLSPRAQMQVDLNVAKGHYDFCVNAAAYLAIEEIPIPKELKDKMLKLRHTIEQLEEVLK